MAETKAIRIEKESDRRIDTIYALKKAVESARRGYWGQCVERVETARQAAYEWEKLAEKTPRRKRVRIA